MAMSPSQFSVAHAQVSHADDFGLARTAPKSDLTPGKSGHTLLYHPSNPCGLLPLILPFGLSEFHRHHTELHPVPGFGPGADRPASCDNPPCRFDGLRSALVPPARVRPEALQDA